MIILPTRSLKIVGAQAMECVYIYVSILRIFHVSLNTHTMYDTKIYTFYCYAFVARHGAHDAFALQLSVLILHQGEERTNNQRHVVFTFIL